MAVLTAPLTGAAAVGAGLVAGLFFAFSVAVMPALRRVDPAAAVRVMQTINTVIVRPPFLVVFLGTAVACGALALLAPDPPRLAGAGCYLIGTVGVTAVCNVPLNTALDRDGTPLWPRYESRWTAWNHVRTLAGAAATLLLVLSG